MKLHEVASPKSTDSKKGTYAAVKFSKSTIANLSAFCVENSIKNAIPSVKLHTTLLYSRKFLPNYKPLGPLKKALLGTPKEFVIWTSRSDDPKKQPTKCLVLKYDCPELKERHEYLMDKHEAEYDFENYESHITLSYDVGDDFDIKAINTKLSDIDTIEIVQEYGEDLKLDWTDSL